MRNPFFYLLLALLVGLDAWLMAHPNLIGRFGVWFYQYDYLRDFPRALGTVSAVVGVALGLDWANRRFFKRPIALLIAAMLTIVALLWVVQSVSQFTSGVYQYTGAGFRAGAILLPTLVTMVFAKGVYDLFTRR